MPVATVTFKKCILNVPECEPGDGRVGSRVFFDLEIDGARHPDLCVDIVHPVGEALAEQPVAVTRPSGYGGPLNFPVFRDLVTFYYFQVVGARGLLGGLREPRLFRGYTLAPEMQVQFEVGGRDA